MPLDMPKYPQTELDKFTSVGTEMWNGKQGSYHNSCYGIMVHHSSGSLHMHYANCTQELKLYTYSGVHTIVVPPDLLATGRLWYMQI